MEPTQSARSDGELQAALLTALYPVDLTDAQALQVSALVLPVVRREQASALRQAAIYYGTCGDYDVMRQLRDRANELDPQ